MATSKKSGLKVSCGDTLSMKTVHNAPKTKTKMGIIPAATGKPRGKLRG
jgi:hypothetical protein